jgi:hypothetical protein
MPKKRITTYHKILKEFTKKNNKLPEEQKISIKERRRIIKEDILPKFKGIPKSKVKVRDIKSLIVTAIKNVPPKEICDLNYIDTSEYAYVEWYALDETISELVPDCVYVKVSAGDFGETRIVNTRNYEYSRNGVRAIVERIRPEADNSSGKYIFSGYQKLRPRKKNNGTPENYYLDFVLFEVDSKGNQKPQASTESVKYELPETTKTKKTKNKIKNIIEKKIKSLKQKREGKKRARKTLDKNIDRFTKITKAITKASEKKQTPKSKKALSNAKALARKQFVKASKLLEKYYNEGKLTKVQYDKAFEKLFKEFNQ